MALPSYDWPAAAAAVLAVGARPIAVDVDLATGTIDPISLAARFVPEARAVIITHLGGRPAELAPLVALARERDLIVIEDCAQALDATYRSRSVGSFGHLGAFSFGPNKLVSAGEGGVLVTDGDHMYERAVRFSQHPLYQRLRGVEPDPLHLNFRMHPCASVLALPQFDELDSRLERIRANAGHWMRLFQQRPGFVLPVLPAGAEPSWWNFAVRYDEAAWGAPQTLVVAALQAEGVPVVAGPLTRTVCALVRRTAAAEDTCCPAAELWCQTALQLPCPAADPDAFARFADDVARAIDKVYSGRTTLQLVSGMLRLPAGYEALRDQTTPADGVRKELHQPSPNMT